MTHWYFIGFCFVFSIFVIKYIISWVFGDLDVDVDMDGDMDFDISSLFSFKGILHFLIGFFGFLTGITRFSSTFSIHEPYEFSVWNYICACICGIIFMIILYYAYKITYKFNHENVDMPDFTNCNGYILTNNHNGTYEVLIYTSAGTFKKTFKSDKSFENGDQVKIQKINNEYTI